MNLQSKKRPFAIASILLATMTFMVPFQNCSQEVGFSTDPVVVDDLAAPTAAPSVAPTAAPSVAPTVAPTAAPSVAPSVAPTAAPTAAPTVAPTVAPTAAPTVAPTAVPTPTGPQCKADEKLVNGVCVKVFAGCTSFVALGNLTTIPALVNGSGVCYYKKLMLAVTKQGSGTQFSVRATDVFARGHGSLAGNLPVNPYVLGDMSLELTFLGERSLSLTGNYTELNNLYNYPLIIDNFILAEVTDSILPKRMLARGSQDVPPVKNAENEYDKILVANGNVYEPVNNFIAYQAGGPATVPVIQMADELEINLNVPTKMRFRMLDCGGSAESSHMYLIIH